MRVLLSCVIVAKYQNITHFHLEYPLDNVLCLWDAFRHCPKTTCSFQLPQQHNYNDKYDTSQTLAICIPGIVPNISVIILFKPPNNLVPFNI